MTGSDQVTLDMLNNPSFSKLVSGVQTHVNSKEGFIPEEHGGMISLQDQQENLNGFEVRHIGIGAINTD